MPQEAWTEVKTGIAQRSLLGGWGVGCCCCRETTCCFPAVSLGGLAGAGSLRWILDTTTPPASLRGQNLCRELWLGRSLKHGRLQQPCPDVMP